MTASPGLEPQNAHAAPAPAARNAGRKRKITPFSIFKNVWLLLVIVAVVAAGAFAVDRLRDVFGSDVHIRPGYEPIATEAKTSKPKRVLYELFGTTGAKGKVRINYYNENTDPTGLIVPSLPWSKLITTTNTSMAANIMAQTDGDTIGCRITVDDDIKDEKIATGPNALTSCLVKSA